MSHQNMPNDDEMDSIQHSLDGEHEPLLGHQDRAVNYGGDSGENADVEEQISLRTVIRETPWRKRIILLTAAMIDFSSLCCYAMMAPFFPLAADSKGISSTQLGMIMSSFELVMFLGSFIFGRYISAIGPRFMLISGIFLESCAIMLFGVLQWCPPGSIFVAMAIACAFVQAIGASMAATSSMAIIANEFPHRIATVLGFLETFAGIGLMAGPPIGGALYQIGGFYLPFMVLGALDLLTGILAFYIMPRTIQVDDKDRSEMFRTFIKQPTVLVCGLCVASCGALITFLDPVLSKRLADLDPELADNTAIIGLVFLAEPALYAILSPVIGYFSDTMKQPMVLLLVGNVGFFAAYLLIGPTPIIAFLPSRSLWLLIVSFSSLGFFIAFCIMPPFAAMNNAAIQAGLTNDIDLYGLIAGFYESAFSLGSFLGPLLGGILVQKVGFEWATSLAAIVPLVDLAVLTLFGVYMFFTLRRPQSSPQFLSI